MDYRVTEAHRSEFPHPITLQPGDPLQVGERYQGPEGWDNWYLCQTPGQAAGWVPAQVIGRNAQGEAVAAESYCARELDVDVGQHVRGERELNSWVWCEVIGGTSSGWVPLGVLTPIAEEG